MCARAEDDLPSLPAERDSGKWLHTVSDAWSSEVAAAAAARRPASLWRALWSCSKYGIVYSGFLRAIELAVTFSLSALLTLIIGYLNGESTSVKTAAAAAVALFVRSLPVCACAVRWPPGCASVLA